MNQINLKPQKKQDLHQYRGVDFWCHGRVVCGDTLGLSDLLVTGDISLHCTALHVQIKWQEEPQGTSLPIGHLLDTALSSGEKYFQARALSTSLSFGTVYIVKSDFTEIYLILAFKI